MRQWIEALCEPKRLFLAWQSPDMSLAHRYRWAVGLVVPDGTDFTFRYFAPGDEFEGHNQGKSFNDLRALGYEGYPAFDMRVPEHREGVRAALMRRVPPRSRSDFAEYMARFLLRPDANLSDLALLGRTEATLPSDGFSLVDPLNGEASRCDVLLEVAGHRYYAKDQKLRIGQAVEIAADPGNPYDPNAVEFRVEGKKIGNVNRLQAAAFLRWLETATVEGWLERLNGSADRPRAFAFVRVTPRAARLAA